EVLWALRDAHAHGTSTRFEPVAFVDRERGPHLKGLPVLTLDDLPRDTLLICGIGGMTEIKSAVTRRAEELGWSFSPAAVAAGALIGPDVTLGDGTIVCAGS